MTNKKSLEIFFLNLTLIIIIIFGFYLCIIGGYGSDEDTLPMIYVFESRLNDGTFVTSRFTGNPVAEIGIGFLSYYFGSKIVNLVTYIFFLISLVFIYCANFEKNNIKLFLILCLSNQVLFFDNLEPIDYSWALLPFSMGLFFFAKKKYELAILFFAISVGTRINFFIFIIPIVFFFFDNVIKEKLVENFIRIFVIFFVGSLFYLPIWYDYSFSLEWLTAARPINQGILGLSARFIYKFILVFGYLQLFIILITFLRSRSLIFLFLNKKYLVLIIFLNLLLFFYIPAELSYLQPALIFTYFFISQYFSKRIIYLIIFLNFVSWIVNYDFVKIHYKSENKCDPIEAIDAEFNFSIKTGSVKKYINDRNLIECWAYDTDYSRTQKILEGKPLK